MEIQNLFAQRIGGKEFGINNEVYKFALIKKWKQEAEKKHSNNFKLIDMGVGEPDWAADDKVVDMLSIEAGKPENRFYSDNGIPEFQNAAIKYMEEVFGISNLTINNVIHGIGSKPILAMLPSCFINPGDYVLNTIPGYPVLATHAKYLGGKIYDLPLKEGGAGRLFGSVTNQEIADALAKTGIKLDKRKITIAEPIKNVGTYTVTCKLGYEISAPLTVKIVEA